MKTINICRVCLVANDYTLYKDIFMEHTGYFVCDMINVLTNVYIKAGDGLPNSICENCLRELEIAIKFKLKCENSNNILTSRRLDDILNTQKVNINECENDIENNIKIEHILDTEEHLNEDFLEETYDGEIKLEPDIGTTVKDEADVKDVEPKMIIGKDGVLKKSKAIDLQLECDDCGGKFKSKCKLRVHWKKVHLLERLMCHFCKRIFHSIATYKKHDKIHCSKYVANLTIIGVGKLRKFKCKLCEYQSTCIRYVVQHVRTHTNEAPYECEICFQRFKQHSAVGTHKSSAHKEILMDCPCPYCGKIFKGQLNCKRHIRTNHTNPSIEIPCTHCMQ